MKTEVKYLVECFFNDCWSDMSTPFKTEQDAEKYLADMKRQDGKMSVEYDYRLVRVTTTREVVK